MFKTKHLLSALIAVAFSAFANASILEVPVTTQYELSQDPIDLGVQSTEVNSFELAQAHDDLALQVEYSEAIKLERSIEPAFVLTTFYSVPLDIVNEVGWRRSYSL
jgi:hypothetical protein